MISLTMFLNLVDQENETTKLFDLNQFYRNFIPSNPSLSLLVSLSANKLIDFGGEHSMLMSST